MILSRQFPACLFFFYEKVLSVKKHSQAKINQQNKIKQTLNNKGDIFYARKHLKVVFLKLSRFFSAQNFFVKKYN